MIHNMNQGASEDFKKYAKSLNLQSTLVEDYQKSFQGMTPNIVEQGKKDGVVIDVFSRLMEERTIFLGTPVDDGIANVIVAQLLYLESADQKKDINIYINSPGGAVYAGLGIYDTMQYIQPDISTTCVGLAASMGAVLLTAGTAGKRHGLPHSRVMIHQPLGGAEGQASDIQIKAEQISILKDELTQIIANHSGQDPEKVRDDSDRDKWMIANEAKEYGMIDEVIRKTK